MTVKDKTTEDPWAGNDIKEAKEKMRKALGQDPERIKYLDEYLSHLGADTSLSRRSQLAINELSQTIRAAPCQVLSSNPSNENIPQTNFAILINENAALTKELKKAKKEISSLKSKVRLSNEQARPINGSCEVCKFAEQYSSGTFKCRNGIVASMFPSRAKKFKFDHSCDKHVSLITATSKPNVEEDTINPGGEGI
jgi:hypothetical protein